MLNILEINDFAAPELDIYARRTEAQLLNKDNPEAGLFIAESPKVIGRALDAGYIPVSALVEKQCRFSYPELLMKPAMELAQSVRIMVSSPADTNT